MKTDVPFEFHKLSPSLIDENAPSYRICETALNQAYENEEIKNIAVTGIHGSGKSSILKTYYYCNKKRNRNLIKVAIADFGDLHYKSQDNDDLDDDQKNSTKKRPEKIKIAERQIINQILYQIPSRKIPLSKFQIKERRGWWKSLLLTVIFIMFIIGVFSLFNDNLLMFICSELLEIVDTTYWIKLVVTTCLIIPVMLAVWWLARRINFRLNKISFKGAESELIENDDTELLDQEAREIVYLILASEIETLIFEDLDRFNDVSIFVRLREINSLVNSRSKKTVRFIYVVRDGLFEFKDRTKFFDLIIPVIPYVTSHNSRGKILEIFGDIEYESFRIDSEILRQLSIYIDDMRVLYAIRNEYEIYTRSIDTDVYAKELFALIVLKNVFPKEFEDLENDRGYLYKVLNKRDTLLNEYENTIQSKRSDLEELNYLIGTRRTYAIAANIPGDVEIEGQGNRTLAVTLSNWADEPTRVRIITRGRERSQLNYDSFVQNLCEMTPNLKTELEKLNYEDAAIKKKEIEEELDRLDNKYNTRYITKTNELLNQLDEKSKSKYFEEEGYSAISRDHYFPLIEYLISTGLIDENYWRYKGFFHKGDLGKNDITYINRVLTGKKIRNDFKLDNPSIVVRYFREEDYSRRDIVNYDLIDQLLNHNYKNELGRVTDVILLTEDNDAVDNFIDYSYEKLKTFTFMMIEVGFEKFWEFCINTMIPKDLKLKMAGIACQKDGLASNLEFNRFVTEHSELLEFDFIPKKESIVLGIKKLKIKFNDVSTVDVSSKLAHLLIRNNLFVLSVDNILNMVSLYLKMRAKVVITKLYKYIYLEEELQSLKKEIIEDLDEKLKEYIVRINDDNIKSESGEDVFIDILNSEIELDTKKGFIEIESSAISDLSRVESDDLLDYLFGHSLVIYNEKNVIDYYERKGTTQTLIAFLNDNNNCKFPLPKAMCKDLVNESETNIGLFNLVIDDIDNEIELLNPELDNERYRKLIEKELIELNENNFEILLKTVEDNLVTEYLSAFPNRLYEFLIENDFVVSLPMETLYELLDKNIISETDSYDVFIDDYGKPLSLFKILNASINVRKYVLQNWIDETDYQRIIDDPNNFDLWNEFITIMNNDNTRWETVLNQNLNSKFIEKALKDDNLTVSHKMELIIKIITRQIFVESWQKWLECLEETRNMASVFNNGKPLIGTTHEARVSDALETIGITTKGKDNRLHFRLKKYKKLRR